jgi:hypothetical protein
MRIFLSSLLILARFRYLSFPTADATLDSRSTDVGNYGVAEGISGRGLTLSNVALLISAMADPRARESRSQRALTFPAVFLDQSYIIESIKGKHTPNPTLHPNLISMSQMHTSHRFFA